MRATSNMPSPTANALSLDVEDYYQVQSLSGAYPRSAWESAPSRVERNTDRMLEIFADAEAHATFFTLGWVAERHGALMRRIVDAGHEVASHGYCHERVDSQTPEEFRADIRKAKRILEDVSGTPVRGYRAATFSVGPHTPWAFRILEEEGHAYSSSVYPVKHDNYAFPNAPRFAYRPQGTSRLWEIPIATVRFAGRNFACGGGGYFRLFPYEVFRAALAHINSSDRQPAVFYLHPWEIDPDQPRPGGLPFKSRFRHYLNLSKTEPRLRRLLKDFRWDRMDRVFNETRLSGDRMAAA
jgi:polysaccharide deacetylase family protein (PEP-CTERM system associated)